jgi:F-type H+-transporting ATPase subunit epsilon
MALPSKLTLNIVSPDTSISQEVDEVSMPGVEGDFGVLPGHTPFFTVLRPGTMWYRQGTEKHVLLVAMGFVEVLPESVSVLAQVAERAEDLDQARAEEGMKRAEEVLKIGDHDIDFVRARLAMIRTLEELQNVTRRDTRIPG